LHMCLCSFLCSVHRRGHCFPVNAFGHLPHDLLFSLLTSVIHTSLDLWGQRAEHEGQSSYFWLAFSSLSRWHSGGNGWLRFLGWFFIFQSGGPFEDALKICHIWHIFQSLWLMAGWGIGAPHQFLVHPGPIWGTCFVGVRIREFLLLRCDKLLLMREGGIISDMWTGNSTDNGEQMLK
jgi:hypothetical protein